MHVLTTEPSGTNEKAIVSLTDAIVYIYYTHSLNFGPIMTRHLELMSKIHGESGEGKFLAPCTGLEMWKTPQAMAKWIGRRTQDQKVWGSIPSAGHV